MKGITEQEEKQYDRISDKRNLYFYGDIDVLNEKHIKNIRDYNLIYKDGRGLMFTNFNYEAGNYTTVDQFNGKEIEKVVRWGPCIDALAWFKFNHCLLGKPKKVVVYNASYGELHFLNR